jgi:hypothetical protein
MAEDCDGSARDMPRLLAFYRDTGDTEGTTSGWTSVAWGLRHPDGTVVTVPAAGPPAVSLWYDLDEAAVGLDAYVDGLEARRHLPDDADGGEPHDGGCSDGGCSAGR